MILDTFSRYRTGLYLSIVAAVAGCALWGFYFPHVLAEIPSETTIVICTILILIPFFIWVQSALALIGVIVMIFTAAALIWPLLSWKVTVMPPQRTALFVIVAALNLLAVGVILSKGFRGEFKEERKRRPAYKRYLGLLVIIALIAAAIIATFLDIIRLASA
jgi:hypothetical protein